MIDHFYQRNWETGQAIRWRIQRADGQPMGVASLWDQWTDTANGEIITSFTMLTVNADGHPVMGRFHRPEDEKRSIVVLEPSLFHDWLHADTEQACDFMRAPPAGALEAEPAPVVKVHAGVKQNLSLF
jgi:putative SOS response-associated peptidase YedK